MTKRLSHLVAAALLVGAAATAAVLVNVLLLGRASASNDPVGHLRARTHLPAAPAWTVRPTNGEVENDGADD